VGKHLLILPLFLAALTAGCAAHAVPPPRSAPALLPANTFDGKWSTNIDPASGPIAQIYVREDLLFAYTADGTSYVLSRDTGRLLHVHYLNGGLANLHPPIVFKDNIIYTALNSLQLYDRRRGDFVRTIHLPLAVRSGATGYRNELFLGADYPDGGRLVCLDLTREYVPTRWTLMFPGASESSAPTVYEDVVYAAGEDGNVAAVSVDNREPAWSFGYFVTLGPVYADLQVDETGLYVASADTKLYCINRVSGKVKWQYFSGTALKDSPTLTKDLIFQYVPGTGLVALEKGPPVVDDPKGPFFDRQPRWIDADATQFLAEDNQHVYVAQTDGSVAALDKTTGNPIFFTKKKGFVAFAPDATDNIVYAATDDHRVVALRPVLGTGIVGELVEVTHPNTDRPQVALTPSN
jgi:outer membrane protein assembly factor BamB